MRYFDRSKLNNVSVALHASASDEEGAVKTVSLESKAVVTVMSDADSAFEHANMLVDTAFWGLLGKDQAYRFHPGLEAS